MKDHKGMGRPGPRGHRFTSGIVGGRTIPCVPAEAQRRFRSGYELRPVDLLDLAQLDRLAE